MNIKKLVLVGILVIIGVAAFVYFDPLGLDLLGTKKGSAVVPPHAAAPAAKPAVAAPKATAPVQASAPVATPSASPSVAAPTVTTTAQALQPPLKLSKSIKTAKAKPERSKTADLRHCLELESDAAIAKCAGE